MPCSKCGGELEEGPVYIGPLRFNDMLKCRNCGRVYSKHKAKDQLDKATEAIFG